MAIKKIDKFNIHENPATNTDQFDVENYLNENWRKIKDVVNNNADELENLQTEQNKKLESIEEKNITQDAELEKLKSQIPTGEVEGQTIHIEDSSNLGANVSVKGNSFQETSEQGKNLLDTNNLQLFNDSKYIRNVDKIQIKKNTTYTYYSLLDFHDTAITLIDSENNETKAVLTSKSRDPMIRTFETGENISFTFYASENGSSGETIYNNVQEFIDATHIMILEGDYTADNIPAYEPFVPDKPSIKYESPVESVGQNVNIIKSVQISEAPTPYLVALYVDADIRPDATYTLSGKATPNNTYYIEQQDVTIVDGSYRFAVSADGKFSLTFKTKANFTGQEKFEQGYRMLKNNPNNKENIFEDLKLEEGAVATACSPYGQGSVAITKVNKNLLNYRNIETSAKQTGIAVDDAGYVYDTTPNDDGRNWSFESSNWKLNLKTGTYTISFIFLKQTVNSGSAAFVLTEKSEKLGSVNLANKNNEKFSFTLDKDQKIGIELKTFEGKCRIQLEEGSVATDYEPHQSETKILPIQKEMLEGDYFDLENKIEVHTWKHIIADGVNYCANYIFPTGYFTLRKKEGDLYNAIDDAKPVPGWGDKGQVICNKLKNVSVADIMQRSYEGIAIDSEGHVAIKLDNSSEENIWDTEKVNIFLQENNLDIYYKLAEPENLDLTEEQIKILTELENWATYKNVTNMHNDSIAILKVNYTKDLETLLNKLSTIQTSATVHEEPSIETNTKKELEEIENSKMEGGEEE